MSEKKNIKIFVSHRIDMEAETIDNPLYVNVRCGAVFDNRGGAIDMLGDDTGDNISEKRESFNELTVQYWAWKNVDADYYGLCHYRRYFSLTDKKYTTDIYSNIIENYINKSSIQKYGLEDSYYINDLLDKYDIIVTEPYDVSHVVRNLKEQYEFTKYLPVEHIDILLDVIKEKYPNYYKDAKNYIYSTKLIPCLMFIMNKTLFYEYNEFCFDILNELEKRIDVSKLSSEGIRCYGHLGERLLGIFVTNKQINHKIKYLQRVVFLKSDKLKELQPLTDNSINIVLSSSDYYVPYLYVTIFSFLEYKSDNDIYNIIILTADISKNNIELLKQLESIKKNVYITIYDVGSLISDYSFKANNHISVETFYRLFIPYIFKNFDKIIFLDSDLIIKRNIADILKESNFNYTINATRDPDYISQYYSIEKVNKYTDDIIKLSEVENYFQAGVLVFNIKLFNQKYSLEKLLNYASSREFIYLDQDVMNHFFEDDIFHINMKWNVMSNCADIRLLNIRLFAPKSIYNQYLEARKEPYIIHYAGYAKPWDRPEDDFANDFWEVARKTYVYEIILKRLMLANSNHLIALNNQKSLKIKVINKLKFIFIRILPKESFLYTQSRKIYHKLLNS